LLAFAAAFVVLAPYAAVTARPPSLLFLLVLALAGSFVPDLLLRQQVSSRREAIFLDLPETLSVLALALGAGQSLRRALELAAKDTPGPLGAELQPALTLAPRERGLGEREALVRVAREAGEPTFIRFCELLAAKESPYLEFLRLQAKQLRSEQARHLERAADRAYLAMHAPLAPLLAVLVLLLAYGFLRFLAHTVQPRKEVTPMSDAFWSRLLAWAARLRHEERGDSLVNWVVLAVGLAAAAAAVVALLRPAITDAAQKMVNFISGG